MTRTTKGIFEGDMCCHGSGRGRRYVRYPLRGRSGGRVYRQVIYVLAAKEEVIVDNDVEWNKLHYPRCVEKLAALSAKHLDVLEGNGCVGLVD